MKKNSITKYFLSILSYTLTTQYGIHKNPLIIIFYDEKCRKRLCHKE